LKKLLIVFCLVLILVPQVYAFGPKLSAGAFGGVNIPIVQDDQGQGTVFGLMARFNAFGIFSIEPNISFGKWGKPDPVDGFDLGIDGSKIRSYGVELLLGGLPGTVGVKPYFLAGFGYYSIKNDDTDYDESNLGYSIGLGIDIGILPKIDFDLRAKAILVPVGDTSKKAVTITGGILYNFGVGM
jgi:hypothetical protein